MNLKETGGGFIDELRKAREQAGPLFAVWLGLLVIVAILFGPVCAFKDKLKPFELPVSLFAIIFMSLFVISCVLFIVFGVLIVRRGKDKEGESQEEELYINTGRNFNKYCQVYHKYIEEDYSSEASQRANPTTSRFIFTVFGFSPKDLMQMIARKLETNIDEVREWGTDANSFLSVVNGKYGRELFPHFNAFSNYANENPFRMTRVLFLSGQPKYDGTKEDFIRFEWLNGSVPCYIILSHKDNLPTRVYNLSDYVIFFEDSEVNGLEDIRRLLKHPRPKIKSDIIFQYQGNARILLVSHLAPDDTAIDYYDLCTSFLTGRLPLRPLQKYMAAKKFVKYGNETRKRYEIINKVISHKK